MDVSIIIVNYNTKELTINCLKSIYENTKGISFEVIVSDNGSTDGSIEQIKQAFPQVILLENNENLGFGAANNKGLEIAKGKYIFYLNSDTILLNNAVKILFDFWENSDNNSEIGALGTNLINKDREIIHSYGYFPTTLQLIRDRIRRPLAMTARMILKKYRVPKRNNLFFNAMFGDVDYITGADLFVKNDKNAFFDERYFMYTEEVDLQYKLKEKGLRRIIIDGPLIIHLEGASSKKNNYNLLDYYASFSKIYQDISYTKFIAYNINKFSAFLCLLVLLPCWFHPVVIKRTRKYFHELREILL